MTVTDASTSGGFLFYIASGLVPRRLSLEGGMARLRFIDSIILIDAREHIINISMMTVGDPLSEKKHNNKVSFSEILTLSSSQNSYCCEPWKY